VLSGDVGSPSVARIGEKGFVWIELEAQGRSAAGAHPHLGDNAIDRLIAALAALRSLAQSTDPLPAGIRAAVEKAAPLSEPLNGGPGETRTLTEVTLNIGLIQGGLRINNVPSKASARIDIRIPPGSSVAGMQRKIEALLSSMPQITWRMLDSADPNWTNPDAEIVQLLAANAEAVLRQPVGISIRPGFSDGRFFRERNVPTVVYGVTPNNGNAPDEYVLISDLEAVYRVHACTAFDFLLRS
jgi:acetylornithine deacetylase/succinyl-diaminopimelate desuccinylase-like protein